MNRHLKTMFDCLLAFVPAERSVVFIAVGFLLVNLFLGVIMGSMISVYDSSNEQESSTHRSAWGSYISGKVLNLMPSSESSTPLSLAGASFRVQAPTDKLREEGEGWIVFSGAAIAPDPAQADLLLSYETNKTWVVSSLRPQSPELALMGWFVLRRLSPEFRHTHGLSDMPAPNAATVVLRSNATQERDDNTAIKSMIALLFHYSTIFPCLGLLFVSSGVLSFQIDRERATGALEPFAMAASPMWVLFLSRALARTTLPTITCAIMLAVSFSFAGFPHPAVYLLLMICLWLGSLLINMIGQLHVVWFHHRLSRIIGTALFNPLIPSGIVFVLFGGKFADKLIARMKHSDSLYSGLPLVSTTVQDAFSVAQVFIPLALATVVLFCLILEWRLGARRQGLARLY